MPLDPSKNTGIHALDITQQISTDKQYYWKSGCGASLTSETATIETHIDAGTVVFGSRTISVPATDIAHDDGDTTNPRWDTICVANDSGGLQIYKGTPESPDTDDSGAELRGGQAYTPSPSDSIPTDVIPLAMVWIPEGASSNSDLTNTSAGGVNNPIIDRRITQSGQAEQVTHRGHLSSSGWYRIARNGSVADGASDGDRAEALFTVRDTESSNHGSLAFRAGVVFGNNPTISLQNTTSLGGTAGVFTKIRLVHGGTYEGAAVEVYVDMGSMTDVSYVYSSLYQNKWAAGWIPVEWAAGSVPTGFSTTVIDLADNPMLANARESNHFKVDGNGRATAEEVFPRNLGVKATVDANTIVPANTEHRIPFNMVIRDPRGSFDPSANLYTVPFDGIYEVKLTCGWLGTSNFSGPTQLRNFIRNVSTSTILTQAFDMGNSSAVNVSVQIEDELDLTAGDQLEAIAYHKGDGDASMNDGADWIRWIIRPIGGSNL